MNLDIAQIILDTTWNSIFFILILLIYYFILVIENKNKVNKKIYKICIYITFMISIIPRISILDNFYNIHLKKDAYIQCGVDFYNPDKYVSDLEIKYLITYFLFLFIFIILFKKHWKIIKQSLKEFIIVFIFSAVLHFLMIGRNIYYFGHVAKQITLPDINYVVALTFWLVIMFIITKFLNFKTKNREIK